MYKKKLFFLTFIIVVLNNTIIKADNIVWMGWIDPNWNTAGNWSLNTVPTHADQIFMEDRGKAFPFPILTSSDDVYCGTLKFNQYADGGQLDMTGGTLTVYGLAYMNVGVSYTSVSNISGGEMLVGTNMYLPYSGMHTLNITEGSIEITGTLIICSQAGSDGFINLAGGCIEASDFIWNTGPDRFGHIDINGGILKINSLTDHTSELLALVDSNHITFYGSGSTRDNWVSDPLASYSIVYDGISTALSAAYPTSFVIDDFESYYDTYDLLTEWQTIGNIQIELSDIHHGNGICVQIDCNSISASAGILNNFEMPQNWEAAGMNILSFWLDGENLTDPCMLFSVTLCDAVNSVSIDNSFMRMSSGINENYEWGQIFNLYLNDFVNEGLDLSDIRSIAINFDDSLSSYRLYLDGIRLYSAKCILYSEADLNDDCSVDVEDFIIIADSWLD